MFELGGFEECESINPREFLVLMISTTSDNFPAVVSGIFEVFGEGGKLETADFLSLYAYLASLDGDISQQTLDDLNNSLEGTTFLTFASIKSNNVLKERLAVI